MLSNQIDAQPPYSSVSGGSCGFNIAVEYSVKGSGDVNLGIFNFVTTRNYLWCNASGAFFSFENVFGQTPPAQCQFTPAGCGDTLTVLRSYYLGRSQLFPTGIPVTTSSSSSSGTISSGFPTTGATFPPDGNGTTGGTDDSGHATTNVPASSIGAHVTTTNAVYASGGVGCPHSVNHVLIPFVTIALSICGALLA